MLYWRKYIIGWFPRVTEEKMIRIHATEHDIAQLRTNKYHHVDPIVINRCETVLLRINNIDTNTICHITGKDPRTVRAALHLFNDGGIDALLERNPYRPVSALTPHRTTIEEEFRQRPVQSTKYAVVVIEK